MSELEAHWDRIHRDRPAEETGWYQAYPAWSLAFVEASGLPREAPLIDVGGGAARFVDALIERGYRDLTVLDISGVALHHARLRLGERAARVHWLKSDVTAFEPSRRYRLWHDRAVFHFLTGEEPRARYLAALRRGLAPGGHLVMATFAVDGPRRCSGLAVRPYDAVALGGLLGEEFELRDVARETHRTPEGAEQEFAWFLFRRRSAESAGRSG